MTLVGTPPHHAVTLGDVASALADCGRNPYDGWDTFRAIEGASWRDRIVSGASIARETTVMLAGLGPATVLVFGERPKKFDAEVSVSTAVDLKSLLRRLKSQFPADARIEPLRSCFTGMAGEAPPRVFRVTRTGRRPLYLGVVSVTNRRARAKKTVFLLAHEVKSDWQCQGDADDRESSPR